MYTIKAAMMLDATGDRIVSRYFPIDQRLRTRPEQVEFEKALFAKTSRQNGMQYFSTQTSRFAPKIRPSFRLLATAFPLWGFVGGIFMKFPHITAEISHGSTHYNILVRSYARAAEIISFEGYTVIYKTIVDVTFYVAGSSHENELILLNTLTTLIETLSIVMKDRIDKKGLMEYIDLVFLALDELIDDGVILETDAQAIAQRVNLKSDSPDLPIAEQTMSQVIDRASETLKKFMSN